MTNGKWLRSLDDNALAQYIVLFPKERCSTCYKPDSGPCTSEQCIVAWKLWLERQYEGGIGKEKLKSLLDLLYEVHSSYTLSEDNKKAISKTISIIDMLYNIEKKVPKE